MIANKAKKNLHSLAEANMATATVNGVKVTKGEYGKMKKHVFHQMENTDKDIDTVRKEFHAKFPKHKKVFDHIVDHYDDEGKDPFNK